MAKLGNCWPFADAAEKDGHRKLQPRGDTVRRVTLDIVGTEEGDSDLVPHGKLRA